MQAFNPLSAGMPSFTDMVNIYAQAASSRMQSRNLTQSYNVEQQQLAQKQQMQDVAIAGAQQDMALKASQETRTQMFAQQQFASGLDQLAVNKMNLDRYKRGVVDEIAVYDYYQNGPQSVIGRERRPGGVAVNSGGTQGTNVTTSGTIATVASANKDISKSQDAEESGVTLDLTTGKVTKQ